MNSAAWAGVAAEEAAGAKVGGQAEVPAETRATTGVGSLNINFFTGHRFTQIPTDYDNSGAFPIGAKKTLFYLCNPC